ATATATPGRRPSRRSPPRSPPPRPPSSAAVAGRFDPRTGGVRPTRRSRWSPSASSSAERGGAVFAARPGGGKAKRPGGLPRPSVQPRSIWLGWRRLSSVLWSAARETPWSGLRRFADVRRLQPLRSLRDVELHGLSLTQRAESFALDRGVMHENIRTVLASDEPVPLRVVEPLHLSGCHLLPSYERWLLRSPMQHWGNCAERTRLVNRVKSASKCNLHYDNMSDDKNWA